jgi:hypothetical protein
VRTIRELVGGWRGFGVDNGGVLGGEGEQQRPSAIQLHKGTATVARRKTTGQAVQTGDPMNESLMSPSSKRTLLDWEWGEARAACLLHSIAQK